MFRRPSAESGRLSQMSSNTSIGEWCLSLLSAVHHRCPFPLPSARFTVVAAHGVCPRHRACAEAGTFSAVLFLAAACHRRLSQPPRPPRPSSEGQETCQWPALPGLRRVPITKHPSVAQVIIPFLACLLSANAAQARLAWRSCYRSLSLLGSSSESQYPRSFFLPHSGPQTLLRCGTKNCCLHPDP